MNELVAYFFALALGFTLRKSGRLSGAMTKRISRFLVVVAYPCLILSSITNTYRIETLLERWPIPCGVFLTVVAGFFWAHFTRERFAFADERTRSSFSFLNTVGNYVFLPLPISIYLWGESAGADLVFSALGTDLAVWALAIRLLPEGKRAENIIATALRKPPLLALGAAVTVVLIDSKELFDFFAALHPALSFAGSLAIPLALFILGSGVGGSKLRELGEPSQWSIAGFRLLVLPAATFAVLSALQMDAASARIILLVSAMPSLVASVVLCETYGGNPGYASRSVLLTHLLGALSIPMWIWIFTRFY